MKKIMISQPMAGFTEEQIEETRNRFLDYAKNNGFEVVNSWLREEWKNRDEIQEEIANIPVHFMSKSLGRMCKCHAVYFANGWETARGCKIEYEVAKAYGLEIVYESEVSEQ